jgi:hypothetical protein
MAHRLPAKGSEAILYIVSTRGAAAKEVGLRGYTTRWLVIVRIRHFRARPGGSHLYIVHNTECRGMGSTTPRSLFISFGDVLPSCDRVRSLST